MKGLNKKFLESFQEELSKEGYALERRGELKDMRKRSFIQRKRIVWHHQKEKEFIFSWFKDDNWFCEVSIIKQATKYSIAVKVKMWLLCECKNPTKKSNHQKVDLLKSCLWGFEEANKIVGYECLKEAGGQTFH